MNATPNIPLTSPLTTPIRQLGVKRKSSRSFSTGDGSALAIAAKAATSSGEALIESPVGVSSLLRERRRSNSLRGLKTVRSFDNLEDLKREHEQGYIEKEKAHFSKTKTFFRGGDVILDGIAMKPQKPQTILSRRHYKTICLGAAIAFVILHLSVEINHRIAGNPICALEKESPLWVRECIVFLGGGLFFAVFLQFNRISLSTFRENGDIGTKSSYIASLCATGLAALSVLSLVLDPQWGGYCRDPFGVISSTTMWAEWMVSVPLMVFIAASVDDKPQLSKQDFYYVVSSFGIIFFGVLLQFVKSPFVATVLSLLSLFCCSGVYLLLLHARQAEQMLLLQMQDADRKKGENQRKLLLASRKTTLASCIACLVPLFIVAYILRLSGLVCEDMYFVITMVLSASTKVIFSSFCMDAHLEVSHPAIGLIDAENFGNTSRRAFIRYVFHEVRVPLNSISLGIQILADLKREDSADKTELDTLAMIRDAVNFMGDTLNDVMALQKVEEGSLELIYKPFSIYDLFQNIEDTFVEISASSDVSLDTAVDSNMPTRLIGDKFRIRHVLCNIISNAIKFSNPGSTVRLTVESEGTIDEEFLPKIMEVGVAKHIKFQVIDEGRGISKEDQDSDIFSPFRKLQHGELKTGRGSGLGLAICREIVHMHGGHISYVSALGEGTTFTVVLPLEVSLQCPPSAQQTPNFHSLTTPGGNGSLKASFGRAGSSRKNTANSTSSSGESSGRYTCKLQSHLQVLTARQNSHGSFSLSHSLSPSPQQFARLTNDSTSQEQQVAQLPFVGDHTLDESRFVNKLLCVCEEDELNSSHSSKASKWESRGIDRLPQIANVSEKSSATMTTSNGVSIHEKTKHMTVNIPLIPMNVCEDKPQNPSPEIAMTPSKSFSKDRALSSVTVLVVDDVASNRKLLAMLLMQKGIGRVDFAEDGLKGVEQVRSKGFDCYDLIFMDNTMPTMTGIEATRVLRHEGFTHLIIGLTGNAMSEELVEFTENGADLTLSKPMSAKTLELLLQFVTKHGSNSHGNKKLADIEPRFAM